MISILAEKPDVGNKGISLIQGLTVDSIKSPALTAKWEKRLHEIERGNEDAASFQNDIEKTVAIWCKEINASTVMSSLNMTSFPCPVCGKPMKKNAKGYGCSGFKAEGCTFFVGDICKKKLTENQLKKLLTERDSGLIKGFISKNNKRFDAHLILNYQNKIEFKFVEKKSKKKAK